MKKIMMFALLVLTTISFASESVGTKNCAATQSSQKREIGKKTISSPAASTVTSSSTSVNRE